MKKLILILLIPLIISIGFAEPVNPQVEKEIQEEIAEVQKWISLMNKVEENYIDMSVYPDELESYELSVATVAENYMNKIEEAEIAYYDQTDVGARLKEAEVILAKFGTYKQMFDEYVAYTKVERSKTFLILTREAVKNHKILRRMNVAAYTVVKGEYPVGISKVRSPIRSLRKVKLLYKDGSIASFTNGKLTSETKLK